MLPVELTRYFHDSRLEVESYTRAERLLTVRIEKEIGPETGLIIFQQITFISLPMIMPGESMIARTASEATPEFWTRCLLDYHELEPDDVVFEIVSQDGPVYFVVAKSVDYKIMA